MAVKDYVGLAADLITQDSGRDAMFARIDKIWRIEWGLPPELKAKGWIKEVRSTDGHDALRGVTRILSSRIPSITVWPTSPDPADQEKADAQERALRWFMSVALQRGKTTALRDVVMSAARYDEVCGQIIYLPYQKKMLKGFGAGTASSDAANDRRLQAMERSGPFSIIVRNPRFVHSLYSEYGVEAVCYATIWPTKNVISFYGERAKAIKAKYDKEGRGGAPAYAVWDMCDYDRRVVFAIPLVSGTSRLPELADDLPKGAEVLMDDKNDLGFIPWICRVGGTSLETDSENTHIPMLYSIDHANQYDIQNTLNTIVFSEAVAHAGAPRGKRSGPGSENATVEYGDPAQDIVLPPGAEYERMEPPAIDQGLIQLSNWVQAASEKSTIPRVLQGGNTPNAAFASLNLAVQSGMITIDPYKKLAEQWLSDAVIQMLLWVKKVGDPVEAFEQKKDEVTGKMSLETYTLNPDDINEKGMRIDVTLEADIPVDRQSKIQGASVLQKMGMPKRAALEAVGETDANALLDEARYEAFEDFFLQRIFSKLSQQDQLEFMGKQQEMQMQAQMAMQEQQMAMQQAQQQQAQQPPQQPEVPFPQYRPPGSEMEETGQPGPEVAAGTPPGIEGVEGGGWDPSQGGLPPALAQPGATREMQTGMTQGGEELA